MNVSDFDFELPEELIAQQPAPRGESRLMVLDRGSGSITHSRIADLPEHLRAGDLMVVNNTRVIAARLLGHRVPSGGAVECLLLGPLHCTEWATTADTDSDEPRTNTDNTDKGKPRTNTDNTDRDRPRTNTEGHRLYDALVHPGQKLKEGALIRFEGSSGALMGEVLARRFHGRRTIRLWPESKGTVEELVDSLGHMPLPPYIKRPDTALDHERYQTVYARARGSVAAPTAGLHFTRELLERLESAGIARAEITLHVGYGTFKPVRTEIVEEHTVDLEPYEISRTSADAIEHAKAEGRRVIAVGTTTTRAVEDAALRGGGIVEAGPRSSSLFIHPGFRFQIVDALLTNFHLPRSSLLILVAAFAGRDRIFDAYREAIAERYRFYSYGDAMLIL
jgi:S-adenosylmethionine:tRNA ribosyltransferase-isomerase